jgi:hypothetical protein
LVRFAGAALVGLSLLVAGCQSGVVDKLPVVGKETTDVQTALVKAFGPVEQKIQAGQGWAVLSPVQNGSRELAYLLPAGSAWSVAGKRQILSEQAASASLKQANDDIIVETKKENAPQFAAYKYGANGLEPVDYYALIAPDPTVKMGHFVEVNKYLNVLWHFNDGKLVKAYRVATGRQTEGPEATWKDYKTNFFTPEGRFTVSNFVTNPPFNALKPGDESFAGGASGNPLGTRWMGFTVLQGDNAWVWGIHGTSHPEMIGTWASDGCIRMFTAQAEELFGQVKGKNPALLIVHK